jgi:hypothetical protein
VKSLSSHIKHITEVQNLDYYDSLTDEEKENFDKSTFFIFEKLGLCMELLPILVKYKSVLKREKGKRLYTALIEVIPKGIYTYNQIKKSKIKRFSPIMVDLIVREYQCSLLTAEEYIEVLEGIGKYEEELERLKAKYGLISSN